MRRSRCRRVVGSLKSQFLSKRDGYTRMQLACSRCSDSGDGAKICAQEKQRRGGGSPCPSPTLPPCFFSRRSLNLRYTPLFEHLEKAIVPNKIVGVKDALLPLQTASTAENKFNCVSQVCN